MRHARAFSMLLLALSTGAGALAMISGGCQGNEATQATPVVVAQRDLPIGSRLGPDNLEIATMTARQSGDFNRVDALRDRVSAVALARGEPVLVSKLAPVGTRVGLAAVLPAGTRAITVKVNEVVGVAGFALPGSMVDVMVNAPDERNQRVSKIVLQRIEVLAVAQDSSVGDGKPRVANAVTLAVTPEQAETIDLARSIGQLSLILRNRNDASDAPTPGVRNVDVLRAANSERLSAPSVPVSAAPSPVAAAKSAAPASAAPPAPVDTVQVIRGVAVTRVPVERRSSP